MSVNMAPPLTRVPEKIRSGESIGSPEWGSSSRPSHEKEKVLIVTCFHGGTAQVQARSELKRSNLQAAAPIGRLQYSSSLSGNYGAYLSATARLSIRSGTFDSF